jgi:hypothetical protein
MYDFFFVLPAGSFRFNCNQFLHADASFASFSFHHSGRSVRLPGVLPYAG